MRALILVAATGLASAGCNKDQAVENQVSVDEAATAEGITSNDTTAIDAATGDDANMAADVNYTIEESENATANDATAENGSSRTSPRRTVRPTEAENTRETGNVTENAE